MSLTSKRIYQFAEFELRISARVLTRDGQPIPLGSKAFEVLTCLVLHAGEVVTKDELLKTVWPESFVEEGNLSQHIFALRKALGDRSGFIVTIPGRGYQFTEPVREVVPTPASTGSFVVQHTVERTHVVIEETSSTLPEKDPLDLLAERWGDGGQQPIPGAPGNALLNSIRSSLKVAIAGDATESNRRRASDRPHDPFYRSPESSWRRDWLWAAAVLLAVGVAAGSLLWWRSAHMHLANRKVVLADFDNRTGDPDFDISLKKALAIDLAQSSNIDVMSDSEALATLRLMDHPPGTAFTPDVAREVCVRSNRQVLVAGSISRLDREYLLTLEATDCNSAARLANARAEASTKAVALAALDSAADQLRRTLGKSTQSPPGDTNTDR